MPAKPPHQIHATYFHFGEDPVEATLRVTNRFLIVALLLLALYITFSPFYAEGSYLLRRVIDRGSTAQAYTPKTTSGSITTQIQDALSYRISESGGDPVSIPTSTTEQYRISIPKIGVDGDILEGNSPSILNHGFWRRPKSSTPDRGSNTVITGHRFLYTFGPNTFYHLDKVETGDKIYVDWKDQTYEYTVSEVKVVNPSEISIEDPTDEAILTLYTCHPVWTSKYRLVVRAKKS